MKKVAVVLPCVLLSGAALAQPCTPQWADGFYNAQLRNGPSAAVTWDDGSGPRLLIGGTSSGSYFRQAPLTRPALWDGGSFVASPMRLNGSTLCFTHFDPDGPGPRARSLIVGGTFTQSIDGVAGEFNGLGIWNGSGLETFGFLGFTGVAVRVVCVHDDGAGPKLYVAGNFTIVEGIPTANIAAWDGEWWSTLGSGITLGAGGSITSMVSFDDGSGPALYVGGSFTDAGGVAVTNLARWRGGAWSNPGTVAGNAGQSRLISSLTSVDAPGVGGPALIATGDFSGIDGVAAYRIAKRQAGAWHAMGAVAATTPASSPNGVGVLDGPAGAELYAHMLGGLSRWDGSAWQVVATMPSAQILTVDTSTQPSRLIVGTTQFDSTPVGGLAAFNGTAWSTLAGLGDGFDAPVSDLVMGDIGHGPRVYATGQFNRADGALTFRVAEWDGERWLPMGSGPALGSQYYTLAIYDDGGGDALYVSGDMGQRVYRWTGSAWTQVGQPLGTFGTVQRLKVLDTGSGKRLYAMGQIGALPDIWSLMRLENGQWARVGTTGLNRVVDAEVFDSDGPGGAAPALYICGTLTSTTVDVARFENGAWVDVSPPNADQVSALQVFDDGTGPALYAQGAFVNGAPGLARLRNGQWAAVGTLQGLTSESAEMHVFDDGSGPALYVGSFFTSGNQSYGLVKYQNGVVTPLLPSGGGAGRKAFASTTLLGRPALFFAGNVAYTPGPLQPRMDYIGALVGCPTSCTCDFNLDGDFGTDADIEAFFRCLAGSCCVGCLTADFNGDGEAGTDGDIESFFRVLAGGPC